MYPITPSFNGLSRAKLKQLAKWIRDELDPLVAREGPDVLRADDVVVLHETLLALGKAQDITVLDLRATGIHRAVQDIAGVATRWPGRLCDDCDKIISIWTAKFGPFNRLHPFLCGRGGRLEGIASATEFSKEVLLQRWAKTCPEKLQSKRSHRLGDLGFRAGAWWINPLFAHHAGIIGLESVEGGITFDKHGAYALVLKDTGEVEASSEERFTYRCPQNDKGRFRLTSATPRSRDPVRVLRSHNINSIWGPKAGIRYEGLFSVKGWSIRTAKTRDTVGEEWKEGHIIIEIRMERCDKIPMDEVTMHPTATELDDYSEYKRLRRVHREVKRKSPTASSIKKDFQVAAKAAPPILPLQLTMPPSTAPKVLQKAFPSTSSNSIFKQPQFDEESYNRFSSEEDFVSPMTIPDVDQFTLAMSKGRGTLAVPAYPDRRPAHGRTGPPLSDARLHISPVNSHTSSAQTAVSTQSNIREVAPWVDFDAGLSLPSPSNQAPIIRNEILSQALTDSAELSNDSIEATQRRPKHSMRDSPNRLGVRHEKQDSVDSKGMSPYLSSTGAGKKSDRKPTFARSRNPMAKLFDGVDENADDYFGNTATPVRVASISEGTKAPKLSRRQHSSFDGTMHVLSPAPLRPITSDSPLSPFSMVRRDAIPSNDFTSLFPAMPIAKVDSIATLMLPKDKSTDPFVESPSRRLSMSLPVSLINVISPPRIIKSVDSIASPPVDTRNDKKESREDAVAGQKLRMMNEPKGMEIKVAFRDPFRGSPAPRKALQRESSVDVAPDAVG